LLDEFEAVELIKKNQSKVRTDAKLWILFSFPHQSERVGLLLKLCGLIDMPLAHTL
jgi:hypothetical protein